MPAKSTAADGSRVSASASFSRDHANTCHLFPGVVVGSGRIGTKPTPDAGRCCAECTKSTACVAWTFEPNGTLCFLKDNAVPSSAKPAQNAKASGLHAGPTCTPNQHPSMCPGGAPCHDCGGQLCPCGNFAPPPPPAPAKPQVRACTPPHDKYTFCDASLDIDLRVADLVSRINDTDKPNLLTARGGPDGLQALGALGVPPYYFGTNCLHSVGAGCTSDGHCPTNFPSGPSMAATFDRNLTSTMANVIGHELRALYNVAMAMDATHGIGLDCWGPVINLNRDPRWGRNGEGGSEDPYLMGEVAASWTKGFQYGNETEATAKFLQAVITVKHYVANSLDNTIPRSDMHVDGQDYRKGVEVNRHTTDVNVSNAQLQEYLFAFRAAAKAGARGMMCSYNAVLGVPTCLSPMLKKAREVWTGKSPWGGYITSDSDSVADATSSHHYVSTPAEASCLAIKDGHDDIDSGNTYYNNLLKGVNASYCSMADVDGALARSLKVRFELGMFDSAEDQPLTKLTSADVGTPAAAELNLKATAESIVLLKNAGGPNRGMLPLRPGRKIAVVGPHANASRFLLQVDTGKICSGDGTFDCVESPWHAIERLNVGGTTTMAVGCDLIDQNISTPALEDAAVAAARQADTVVLAIGIAQCGCMGIQDSYMKHLDPDSNVHGCATSVVPPYASWGNCWNHAEVAAGAYIGAEAHDRILIDLPPVQRAFAKKIFALNKPVVLLVLNGGSIDIGPELIGADAAVEAFYPGVQGAGVIANALFGAGPYHNKFGRMPYTTYQADFVHDTPMMEHDLSVHPGRTHKYFTGSPVLRFGHGLSYTSFGLSSSHAAVAINTDGSKDATVVITVRNTGNVVGDCVVLAYLVPKSMPTQPGSKLLQVLFDFGRVEDIPPGGTHAIRIDVGADALKVADLATGDLVSAPGVYELRFDGHGEAAVVVPLAITGPQTVIEPFPKV